MSEELDDLYREVILDHTKHPRNFREISTPTRTADGHNRLCGDKLKIFVKLEKDRIVDLAFKGTGCSISTASASMMTEALKGKTLAEANDLVTGIHSVPTGYPDVAKHAEEVANVAAFHGVRKFPVRVKCATLPWHTLQAALKNDGKAVSTE